MIITHEYKDQLVQLHQEKPNWGTTGRDYAPMVSRIVTDFMPKNILDYGCGKQTLSRALTQYRIIGYDPGIPGMDAPPNPADLVVCTDVLEHVEPDCLDDVLDDLQRVTRLIIFIQVATVKAIEILPDGRNVHLIVEDNRWWMNRIWDRFNLVSCAVGPTSFQAIYEAKNPKGNGSG